MQDLATIGGELKSLGMNLSIETNGTIPVDPIIDWICFAERSVVPQRLNQTTYGRRIEGCLLWSRTQHVRRFATWI